MSHCKLLGLRKDVFYSLGAILLHEGDCRSPYLYGVSGHFNVVIVGGLFRARGLQIVVKGSFIRTIMGVRGTGQGEHFYLNYCHTMVGRFGFVNIVFRGTPTSCHVTKVCAWGCRLAVLLRGGWHGCDVASFFCRWVVVGWILAGRGPPYGGRNGPGSQGAGTQTGPTRATYLAHTRG